MLTKKELMESLKKFSKFTIVSLASLVFVSGSLNNVASARATRHIHYSRRVNKEHSSHRRVNLSKNKVKKIYKYLMHLMNKQWTYSYKSGSALNNHLINFYRNKALDLDPIIYKYYNKYFTKFSMYQIRRLNNCSENGENGGHLELTNHNRNLLRKNHYDDNGNELISNTSRLNHLDKQDNSFDTKLRHDLVNSINNTRRSHGLKPLAVTNALQSDANYRVKKVQYAMEHLNDYKLYSHNTPNPADDWVHGVDDDTTGYEYLQAHNYDFKYYGGNAGNWFKHQSHNLDGSIENNATPQGVANGINDSNMNHDMDQGNNNGHRYNELKLNWKYLGVGVHYNQTKNYGTYTEEFAC